MGDNPINKFYVGDRDGGANAIPFYDGYNSKLLMTELLCWRRFRSLTSQTCHQPKLSPTFVNNEVITRETMLATK